MNKIKAFFNKNFKLILFCAVFIFTCFLYNQNNQTLNAVLKRGVILEYSLQNKTEINQKELEKKLTSVGLKYSVIKNIKNDNSKAYDSDDILVKNLLHIALPLKAEEKQTKLFDDISDYIFDTYPNSKLLNIKTINDNYHKPFSSFLKFLGLTFVSLFIWFILLYLISNDKEFFKNFNNSIKNFLNSKKEALLNYFKKVKERGFGYFIKTVLFEETKDEEGKEKEPDVTKEILSTIVFVVVCVILIRYFIGELRWIPSGSMRPTILEKDRVFVEKLEFPKKEIKRGDILVFYPPEVHLKNDPLSIFTRLSGIFCKDIAFIKRVIGMPNDKFEIKYDSKNEQYRVYINDIALNEPYINSRNNWTPCTSQMYCGPFIIPQGHYFMMGDNRGNSQDSRFWGFLDENRIIGRANFMFWPISRINILTDKYLELHKEKQGKNYKTQNYVINRYELLYKIWHAKRVYSLINILGWLRVYK